MNVYVFPGQGSQEQGMGQALFDEVAEFTIWEPEIDALLGYSLRQLCLDDAEQRLKQTQYTQPALYVVNALHYLKKRAEGAKPDYVAGHSLGEYDALFAAGAFDFMTGLRLVQKRGALMAQSKEGSMAAVVGLGPEQISEALQANGLLEIDMANYNAPSQTVISGPSAEISQAEAVLNEAGARLVIPLQVSAAFHSRLMVPAAERFAEFLAPFEFKALAIPVIANVTARPYPSAHPTETIKKMLVEQITHPVQWTDTIRYLLGQDATDFEEVGPGAVLTGLVRRIKQEATPLIVTEETIEAELPPEAEEIVTVEPSSIPAETITQTEPVYPKTQAVNANAEVEDDAATEAAFAEDTAIEENAETIATPPPTNGHNFLTQITAESLGSAAFKADYGLKYAYIAGAMYKGIASKELVVAMGKAGMIGYLGTGGMSLAEIEANLRYIQAALDEDYPYGMNLLANLIQPEIEEQTVDLFLRYSIRYIEAAAYMQMTPSLVRYRLTGIRRNPDGTITVPNHILAKVSRPEVATLFMQPAPQRYVDKLVAQGQLTVKEA
ncbi:MAG: ACP S-malonyltransferase, partial [Anaerolineae bacterium]|nr:ACP S-malonyltransferase [Anaerolineae bacterium]